MTTSLRIFKNLPMKILIAEDNPVNRTILASQVSKLGYQVFPAADGREALAVWEKESPAIVLTDWLMPGVDGSELCQTIRLREENYTYIIMITSCAQSDDLIAGFDSGVDDYLVKPIEFNELRVRLRAGERLLAQHDKDQVIFALAKLAETRDSETGYHLERVQHYCRALGDYLRRAAIFPEITRQFVDSLFAISPLHDVGKVGIPDRILLKPGKLTEEEFGIMKGHTTLGYQTLQSAYEKNPRAFYLKMSAEIAHSHHERWDGNGYPLGLCGENIPLSARIISLADVFDALVSRRIYKEAFGYDQTSGLIAEGKGTQFDPRVVDAFFAVEKECIAIAERYKD